MVRKASFVLTFAILAGFVSAAHGATTWTVTTGGEPVALNTDDCSGTSCATLRGAINHAQSGDTINFAHALDGATIELTLYTNCLSMTDTLGTTCLPQASEWATAGYVTQFGPSAFYIARYFTLTIDAATGMTHGLTIARAAGAANFRLFDVGVGATLNMSGLRLSNGHAKGGDTNLGGGALGAGGAIFNQGSLTLSRSTLDGNIAQGGDAGLGTGFGGGGAGQDASANGGGPNGGAGVSYIGSNAYGSPGGFGGGGGEGVSSGSSPGEGTGGAGGFGGGGGLSQGRPSIGGGGGFGGGGASGEFGPGVGGFGGGTGGGGGGGMGGAIFNDAGSISLINVTLGGNSATGGSSGGSGYGGAIFNYAGSLNANFVTASGNAVTAGNGGSADGGAIYSLGDAACAGGGNACNTGGNATLTIANSIMANSFGGTDITTNTINGGTSSYTPSTSTLTGTLSIGSLANGGGLEAVMMPPSGINPIVNATSCMGAPPIDQRGVTRPQQGLQCDIGAVERKAIEDTIFLDGFEGY